MSSREIITLQFGHEANFVGTHFWNIQESGFCFDSAAEKSGGPRDQIDHDVLFREGRNHLREVTYTPRLLLFDLKGSLWTLPETGGALYGEPEGEVMWSNDVTLHKAPSPTKNEFLKEVEAEAEGGDVDRDRDETEEEESAVKEGAAKEGAAKEGAEHEDLEEDVTVWSDFIGTQLHPRSLTVVREFCHGVAPGSEGSFDHFLQGWSLFRPGSALREAFEEESLRFFVEECDYLQGFHLLTDSSGFSGCAAAALEYLGDEFSGRARLALPLFPLRLTAPGETSRRRGASLLSALLALTEAERHASALCPLGLSAAPWSRQPVASVFPRLTFDPDRPYHASAVLASSLDSLTLSYRLRSPPHSLGVLTSLASGGRNVLTLRSALPLPEAGSLSDSLRSAPPDDLLTPLSPLAAPLSRSDPLLLCVRGAGPKEALLQFASDQLGPRTAAFCSDLRQPLRRPFPRIFGPAAPLPDSVAAAVALQNCRETGTALQQLREAVQALTLSQCLPAAAADVMELDDVKEMVERFSEICEAYLDEPMC